MKALMTEEITPVYGEPKTETLSITSLKKGDEVETGKVIRKKKDSWVEVILPGGQTGYIAGTTRIFVIRQIELATETELFDSSADTHMILKAMPRGTVLSAIGVEKTDSGTWYRVRDDSGSVGYINSRSKYKVYQEATVGGGKKLIITGAVFAILGLVFLVISMGQQSNSSSLFLIVGLIGLGAIQVVQGVMQYRKAKQKQDK